MGRGLVYKYTSPSGKVYIGICHANREKKRKWDHIYLANSGKGYYFHSAIRKYGFKNFKYEVLAYTASFESAKLLEVAFIKEYKSQDREYGYNVTKGGDSGVPLRIGTLSYSKMVATCRLKHGKRVVAYKDNVEIGKFDSIGECAEYMINVIGDAQSKKYITTKISEICRGNCKRKTYRKIFSFKFEGGIKCQEQ